MQIIKYLKHMRCSAYYKYQHGWLNKIRFAYHMKRYWAYGKRLGFSIGYETLGYGVHIPHYGTIVVNGDCKIGNYCVLHTSVCIGGGGKNIGDGLYVGSGAMIMNPITLGDNVSVASQSLVNKSYEEGNALLAGVPAVIKRYSEPWYIRDGELYSNRVRRIEKLKEQYGV